MKILNFFSHLDDAEIWAGGTINKHYLRGDDIETIVFASAKDERIDESKKAHSILGARLIVYNDIVNLHEKILFLSEMIIDKKPDIVLTHWMYDSHPDHQNTCEIVRKAIIKPWILNGNPKRLFSVNTYSSQGFDRVFNPTHYIDISENFEIKIKSLRCFLSQPTSLWEKMVSVQNQFLGERIRTKYAEGFINIPIQGKYFPDNYLL